MPAPATVLTAIPTRLIQSASVNWTNNLPDYLPSAGFSLIYQFSSPGGGFTLNSSQYNDPLTGFATELHGLEIEGSTSNALAAGDYAWQCFADNNAYRYLVGSGVLTIVQSFANNPTADGRTQARRTLDNINAVIENRAGSAVLEYQIAGRQLKHFSLMELLQVRDRLRLEVQRELAANASSNLLGTGNDAAAPRGRVLVRLL